MEITEILEGKISQVCLDGRFDADSCENVEQFIRGRMDSGIHDFVLNMEKVNFIASAGLRVVLVIARELRRDCQGDLRLAYLQPNVSRVFEISGLNNVLRIFDNMETAVQSFSD